MKKLVAVILVLALALLAVPIAVSAINSEPTYAIPSNEATYLVDGVTYKVVRTVAELKATADAKDNYILANDIDFAGESLSKIASLQAGTVLEGNGCRLFGFTLTGAGDTACFSIANNEKTFIRNLIIGSPDAKIQVSSTGSGKSVGALIGYTNSISEISGITVYADVSSENSTVGGLIGNAKGTHTVTGCRFYGTVNGKVAGGIYGQANGVITISDCINYGDVSGSTDTGGIYGKISSEGNITQTGCANFGDVTSDGNAAGLCGSAAGRSTVTGFLNAGTVVGGTRAGGLLAWVGGNAHTLNGCFVASSVGGAAAKVGGLASDVTVSAVTIKNCRFYGALSSTAAEPAIGVIVSTLGNGLSLKEGSVGNKYFEISGSNDISVEANGKTTLDNSIVDLNANTGYIFIAGAVGLPELTEEYPEPEPIVTTEPDTATTTEEPVVTTTKEPTVTTTEKPIDTTKKEPDITTTNEPNGNTTTAKPSITTKAPEDEGGCGGVSLFIGIFAAVAAIPTLIFIKKH